MFVCQKAGQRARGSPGLRSPPAEWLGINMTKCGEASTPVERAPFCFVQVLRCNAAVSQTTRRPLPRSPVAPMVAVRPQGHGPGGDTLRINGPLQSLLQPGKCGRKSIRSWLQVAEGARHSGMDRSTCESEPRRKRMVRCSPPRPPLPTPAHSCLCAIEAPSKDGFSLHSLPDTLLQVRLLLVPALALLSLGLERLVPRLCGFERDQERSLGLQEVYMCMHAFTLGLRQSRQCLSNIAGLLRSSWQQADPTGKRALTEAHTPSCAQLPPSPTFPWPSPAP